MITHHDRGVSHSPWEADVYGKGRHLNRYPFDMVVAFVMSKFATRADRGAVQILEVGCGAGNNLWFAAREGYSVAGLDLSESAIEYARRRFDQDGYSGDLRVGSFTELPWADQTFDAIIDRTAWTHAPTPQIQAAIAEAHRVMKPGGQLLSVAFSSADPDRVHGTHVGQNDYMDIVGGRFEGLGCVHFFTRDDIARFYEPYFELTALSHLQEEETLASHRRGAAYWRIIATRREA